MSDASIFQIEEGQFALSLVDKNEVGYSDAWQAPGGADVDSATIADYPDAAGTGWTCQVTAGTLTPEPSTTTSNVPATFCSPARSTPTPGETGYTLDASFLQDPHIKAGLSRYLFENDTKEAYFLLGLDGNNPPRAIGRVRVQAGAIGGEARTTLTTDISLPLSRKPQISVRRRQRQRGGAAHRRHRRRCCGYRRHCWHTRLVHPCGVAPPGRRGRAGVQQRDRVA